MASAGSGIGLGSILALIMSWIINQSLGYAFVHAILGWLYVVYVLLTPEHYEIIETALKSIF